MPPRVFSLRFVDATTGGATCRRRVSRRPYPEQQHMRYSNLGPWVRLAALAVSLTSAACADVTNPRRASVLSPAALTGAFSTVPVGYGDLTSSYVGVSASAVRNAGFWLGGGREGGFER